ncbi:MAG: M28 family peptidase [Anaerolineae bacterium]
MLTEAWRTTSRVAWTLLTAGLVALLTTAGCASEPASFDGERAMAHVEALCDLGPRPVGSPGNEAAAAYIQAHLEEHGWDVELQEFAHRGLPVRNVIGRKGEGPVILLGTHFDTRPLADLDPEDRSRPVPGANDGGSGTAVLLELARVLGEDVTGQATIELAFFDGEDRTGLGGWSCCVGSYHAAAELSERPAYVVVVDMVGDATQELYFEWSSTLWLQERIWRLADSMGYGHYFVAEHRHAIVDDHTPFLQQGIPAALIIDFDYIYWHTTHDTPDKLSAASLQRVGNVLETLLKGEPLVDGPMWNSGQTEGP